MPLLLIYIPTFGRSQIAKRQIQSLVRQIETLKEIEPQAIKIYVRVNSDPSYKFEDFDFPNCTLLTSTFNEGADANISYGFYLARTIQAKYLWIVGDDETLPSEALFNVITAIKDFPKAKAIIGSKSALGLKHNPRSVLKLNEDFGRTLSFITSVIYRSDFRLEMFENSYLFSYTSYSHMAMQHCLIAANMWDEVVGIEMQSICDYHEKVKVDPLKPRSEYGQRDSRVFFGKPLSALATRNRGYIEEEFKYWWGKNWHRVSMYLDRREPNGWALLGYSLTYPKLWHYIVLASFPYWRIKEIIRPIRKLRSQ